MNREPKWKENVLIVEAWLVGVIIGVSFIANLISIVKYLVD
jgi:hypothetical protein